MYTVGDLSGAFHKQGSSILASLAAVAVTILRRNSGDVSASITSPSFEKSTEIKSLKKQTKTNKQILLT